MPKWGMEMTEGMIGDWHVALGDTIAKGDDLVDVETSKIVNCVTAHTSGTLRRMLAEPGEMLPVGAILGVIADADASDADIDAYIASVAQPGPAGDEEKTAAPVASQPAGARDTSPESQPAPQQEQAASAHAAFSGSAEGAARLQSADDDTAVAATPVARRIAAASGINLTRVTGTGRHGRVTLRDLESAARSADSSLTLPEHRTLTSPDVDDSELPATPVARRLAETLGVRLRDCKRTGTHGRVSKADVEAAAARLGRTPARPAANAADEPADYVEQTLGGMRRTIARRLQASKQTAPHFRVKISAAVDEALALRQAINSQRSDLKVSLNDILIKASASALLAVPEVNIQFDGETVRRYTDADIAVAVALDDGLITPIIRQANRKGLAAISSEMRDMATRARIGRLKAEEFEGGTFSVSNLGMFGVDEFDAIINPPQAAILAVGATERRPVERADGSWGGCTALTLTLSSDHRIIDGAVAARFLAALKGFIEAPSTMLV